MKKVLALDIGDAWTGIAISDALGMFARPYTTVTTPELEASLQNIIRQEPIETVVVGYPKTMKGLESEQTIKTRKHQEKLAELFPTISWILWDERLSSKRAQGVQSQQKRKKDKSQKLQSHAIAAAFILDTYLKSQTPVL